VIRKVPFSEINAMLNLINDAAEAYRGVIPDDRWKTPYMSTEELKEEIRNGAEFYGYWENNTLIGVMAIQPVKDITLIRHAYVLTSHQRKGVGKRLLLHLLVLARTRRILVGTWEAAFWAVDFYQKQGFKLVPTEEKNRLLREYWKIPERQVETSVVLSLEK
jgi:GNAT superfamily N-acetyltransferase